ncbi:substrate-binding periplasmic protein [Kordiimonas aestuarii]|uniref:substrate-binding periplasmic protein n=1 Tax=Kordiimonas aestuarii TaxID=1005925 RepID=UPI0021CE9CC7|nr:transporter substrate-binding domain-containing protein [Kordiimonas aestuarii]
MNLISRLVCTVAILAVSSLAHSAEPVTASRLGDSVFRDVWHAILNEAGIEAKLIAAPRGVRRDMFVRGELVLDCCSVEAWRNRADEIETQLWTVPFFYTVDHLILQAGRRYDIPDPLDLTAFKVGIVQGFTYKKDTHFGDVISRVSLGEVFEAVAAGEADLTIANHQEFRRRQKLTPLPLVLGPEYHRLGLRARVHNSRPDLLPRVEAAIKRLNANGTIARLTGARLRDMSERGEPQ